MSIIIAASFAVLGWTLAFTLGKGALVALVARALRYPLQVALRVGITLAHGGEFGLLLLTQAVAAGVIGAGPGYAMLVALAFTMGLAPILIQRSAALADRAGITAVRTEEDAVGARQ